MNVRILFFLMLLFLVVASVLNIEYSVSAQSGGNFMVTKSVVAGGGRESSGGNFSVNGTIGQPLVGGTANGGSFSLTSGFWAGGSPLVSQNHAPFDFDGDGRTDLAIYRPSIGEWWWRRSSDGQAQALQFGLGTDVMVPGDYTGDGKADVAVFRPSNGHWYILRSEDMSYFAFPFGTGGDIPAIGDYDGDGRADAAVFRPSNKT